MLDVLRRKTKADVATPFHTHPLAGGSVLEVYGDTGSGKTQVALHVMAQVLLHSELGGGGKSVALVDGDGLFKPLVLHRMLRHAYAAFLLPAGSPHEVAAEADSDAAHDAAMDALSRLSIFRPKTPKAFVASLAAIRRAVRGPNPLHPPLGLLVLDPLWPYFWMARAKVDGAPKALSALPRWITSILASAPSAVVIAPKPAIFQPAAMDDHKEYMPASWRRIVSHRVLLVSEPSLPRRSAFFTLSPSSSSSSSSSSPIHFSITDAGISVDPPLPI